MLGSAGLFLFECAVLWYIAIELIEVLGDDNYWS